MVGRGCLRAAIYGPTHFGVAISPQFTGKRVSSRVFKDWGDPLVSTQRCHIMALTATANLTTCVIVIQSLDMQGCHVISQLPHKPNIFYSVKIKPDNYWDMLQSLIDDLCRRGLQCRIVFCRTYDDTLKMFQTMVLELSKRNCLYGESAKDKRSRLCDKFDACTDASTKAKNY